MHSFTHTSSADYSGEEALIALDRIRAGSNPFAIVKRQEDDHALILEGNIMRLDQLSQIPRRTGKLSSGDITYDTFSAIPYAQVKERGVDMDDPTQILCLVIQRQTRISIDDLLHSIQHEDIHLEKDLTYLTDDGTFASNVQTVKDTYIGKGAGSSFTISRKAQAMIADFGRHKLLSMFRSLQEREYGTYMNFLFHDGQRSLLGVSPERQISVKDGVVTMNPISGTLRKFPEVTKERLLQFLRDPKETMELFMVLDEELKQIAQMCARGGHIIGPHLKEMSKVFHTFYNLIGRSDADPVELFRGTLCPPTLTGSPEGSSHSVIRNIEHSFRRYYAGAMVLIGRKSDKEVLDASITIRTGEIESDGTMTLQAGATITRASDPVEETKETAGKLAGFLHAILASVNEQSHPILPLLFDEDVQAVLRERNYMLSDYHFNDQENVDRTVDVLRGKTVTVIDNGDDFCHMLSHMMVGMGCDVRVMKFDAYDPSVDEADIVLIGPGPGDPTDAGDPKMQKVAEITQYLLKENKKFVSVCLGHQMLCKALGMPLERLDDPQQGVQKTIDLFGIEETVGFYNTYTSKVVPVEGVHTAFDSETGNVHALQSDSFASFQFHPESILSKNGFTVLAKTLERLVRS